jgi:hypothetical protein
MFYFCSCFPFFWLWLKSEKPAIDWQSRVFKICSFISEFHPPDAKTPADARPNGHASIGLRVFQCWSKRVFHIQPAGRNTIGAHLSKAFCFKNGHSQGLSDGEVVLNWFKHERTTTNGHLRVV